jgi:hypothetical protein
MKHIQVIDDALNCTYPIYAVTEQEFALLFPAPGQDIEFAEDVKKRLGKRMGELMAPIWKRWVDKPDVVGIHGTLFYHHGENYQRDIFPKKRSYEMNAYPETLDEVVRLRTIRKERWT